MKEVSLGGGFCGVSGRLVCRNRGDEIKVRTDAKKHRWQIKEEEMIRHDGDKKGEERRTEEQKKAEKDQNMRVKKQCDEANE